MSANKFSILRKGSIFGETRQESGGVKRKTEEKMKIFVNL